MCVSLDGPNEVAGTSRPTLNPPVSTLTQLGAAEALVELINGNRYDDETGAELDTASYADPTIRLTLPEGRVLVQVSVQ